MQSSARAILLGGFVAGTIDLGAASLISGLDPLMIMRAVASGVFGKASFQMGMTSALAGLALQWAMSLIIAAIYVFAARRLAILKTQWIACGLAYGAAIFFVMNYVVVPLSAVGRFPRFTPASFAQNMLAMLLFGLIVAFFARGVKAAA